MARPKILYAGGGERAQYLLHDFNDTTIRFVLNYPGLIDPDILRTAAKAVVESVNVLHSTFFSDPVSAYWYVNENVEENNYFHYISASGDPAATAESLAVLPVYPEDKVQMHVYLVQSETASSMVVRISHMVCDGGDGKYLLNKLIEVYNRIAENGSVEGLEIKDGNRAPEKVYENLTSEERKALRNAGMATSVPTGYPYPNTDSGMNRMTKAVIPAETMGAARKKAKTAGASANDLLITAFYHAYAAMEGVDSHAAMSVSSMMDLRRHCTDGDSAALANMSGSMSTTLENGVGDSFAETLAIVAEQTAKAKENPLAGLEGMPIMHGLVRAMPVGLMIKLMSKVYGNPSIGMTNMGNLKCADYALDGLVPVGGAFGGPLKKKPGMQISVMSFDGECVLSVLGNHTNEDVAVIRGTLDALVKEISAYAAD